MSTTLDVVLCLLLVSAAVGLLAAAGPPPSDHDASTAGDVADRLATTTVAVEYRLSGGSAEATVPSSGRQQSVRGTPALLLARAAVADLAVRDGGGRSDEGENGAFERAVANRTERVLAGMGLAVHANVTATYAPAPGSGVSGRASVGPSAPSGVDVAVARVRVPVGTGPRQVALRNAARADGYAGVARAVADATLATVSPPARARWALRDAATRSTVAERYDRLGDALDVDVTSALQGGRVRRANDLLARALADRYVAGCRDRFEEPVDAAAASRPRVVTITVRTWSA